MAAPMPRAAPVTTTPPPSARAPWAAPGAPGVIGASSCRLPGWHRRDAGVLHRARGDGDHAFHRDPLVGEPELAVYLAHRVGVLADDQPGLLARIEHGGLEVGPRADRAVRLGDGLHVGDGVLA